MNSSSHPKSGPEAFQRRLLPAQVAGAALLVLWIYWPAVHGGWLWDDRNLISLDPTLRTLRGLGQIWTSPSGPDYFPLTATLHWVQWHLWGAQVLGYHLTNVALHAVSAGLLWRVFRRLGIPAAGFGALLFLVHPVAVESVAWISELKNTLSLPPLLLATLAYLNYDQVRRRSQYWLAVGWFLAAMLCKSSVVMFPGLLLLYVGWRRGCIKWADAIATLPFFLISLGLGLVTWWFQQTRAIGLWTVALGGPWSRLAAASLSWFFYLRKCLWPANLIPIYPPWPVHSLSAFQLLPCVALAGLAALVWVKRGSWARHLLFGLGGFALLLLPVVGLVPISFFLFGPAADHLAYLPLVVVCGWVAAAAGVIGKRSTAPSRRWIDVALIAICASLALISRQQAKIYRSETGFWTYTLQYNSTAWIANYGLANVAFESGRISEAIDQYEQALRANPDYAPAQLNLANVLATLPGRIPEALPHFEAALRINPRFDVAHLDYANVLAGIPGRMPEALSHYAAALQINPAYPEAENNLATALAAIAGRSPEAVAHYEAALRINPAYAEAHSNLANLLAALPGRMPEALAHYHAALEINPGFAPAHNSLAIALATLPGRMPEAIAEYQAALRIDSGYAEAHYNLAVAYANSGRNADAIAQFEQARKLNPGLPAIEQYLNRLRRYQLPLIPP